MNWKSACICHNGIFTASSTSSSKASEHFISCATLNNHKMLTFHYPSSALSLFVMFPHRRFKFSRTICRAQRVEAFKFAPDLLENLLKHVSIMKWVLKGLSFKLKNNNLINIVGEEKKRAQWMSFVYSWNI